MKTQSDIARLLGISRATVSLALRDSALVRSDTRDRVHAAARSMGYKPNPTITSLMSQVRAKKSPAISSELAYVSLGSPTEIWKHNPIHAQWKQGFIYKANSLGYGVATFCAGIRGGISLSRLAGILRARGVVSLGLAPFCDYGDLDLHALDSFEVGTIGGSIRCAHRELHRVAIDHFAAMHLALESVSARGYMRPGLAISRSIDQESFGLYRAAFLLGQQSFAKTVSSPLFFYEKLDRGALLSWFQSYKPDVVLSANWEVRRSLLASGIRIPGEVGYITFGHDDSERLDEVAGVDQRPFEVGLMLAHALAERERSPEVGHFSPQRRIHCEPSWIEGSSIRQLEDQYSSSTLSESPL